MDSDASQHKRLFSSSSVIPWKVDWRTKSFIYIDPQIELLLGWPRESWRTLQDWIQRIHPLDRERIVDMRLEEAGAGVDHESEYSAMTSTGQFVLICEFVHVARNQAGEIDSLMGFIVEAKYSGARAEPHISPRR